MVNERDTAPESDSGDTADEDATESAPTSEPAGETDSEDAKSADTESDGA